MSRLKYAEKISEAVKLRSVGLSPAVAEAVAASEREVVRQDSLRKTLEERQSDLESMILKLQKTKGMTAAEMRLKFDAVLTRYDYHPAEELIKMVREVVVTEGGKEFPLLSPSERIRVHSEILSYCTPRVKSSEITHSLDQTFTILVRKFGDDTVGEEKRVGEGKTINIEPGSEVAT